MPREEDRERIIVLLKRLARIQTVGASCISELQGVIGHWEGFSEAAGALANLLGSDEDPALLFSRPIVDSAAMTVTWQGRTCSLGSTVLFRLMERLARRPNQYIPYDRLTSDVWDGCRSDDAVRAAAARLRCRLKKARMPNLAKAIRGTGGHYGLILEELS